MTDDRLSYSFFPWPLRTTLPCRVPLLFGDWILISIAPAVDEREAGLRPVKAQDEAHGGGLTYPQWQQTIAARSVVPIGLYRPGRAASRISCPLLAVISSRDQSVLAAPALKAARRAPGGEVLQVDGTHYAAFLDQHETVVAAELDFLRRHLLQDGPGEDNAALT